MVSILTVLDITFSVPDFYCKVSPLVKPYLKEDLIRLNDKAVIYNCLVDPIPREIWNFVSGLFSIYNSTPMQYFYLGQVYTTELIVALENRRTLEKLGGGKNSLFSVVSGTESTMAGNSTSDIKISKVKSDSILSKEAPINAVIRKLVNLGLNEEVEDKLLSFKNILTKMDTFKRLGN